MIFLGVRNDINLLYSAMDAYLMPSYFEGLGTACVEAQTAGLPCLVSTGVPEEVNLTELVRFLPLSAGAEKWSKELSELITKKRTVPREGYANVVRMAGYDQQTEKFRLAEYYSEIGCC